MVAKGFTIGIWMVFSTCFFSKVVDNWCYQLRLSRYIVMGFSFWDSKCTVPSVTVTGTFATLPEAFFVVKSTRDRLHIEVPYICSATYGGPIPNDMVAQRFPIFGYDKRMMKELYQENWGLNHTQRFGEGCLSRNGITPQTSKHLLTRYLDPRNMHKKTKPQKVFSCLCFGLCWVILTIRMDRRCLCYITAGMTNCGLFSRPWQIYSGKGRIFGWFGYRIWYVKMLDVCMG